MKRVSNCKINTRSKKCKIDPCVYNSFVSATHVYNYMRNDCLSDWLKIYGEITDTTDTTNTNSFATFIMKKGLEFEDEIINYIDTHIHPVVTVSNKITPKTCQETIELMMEGTPFIHSAPVMNEKNGTRGIIDLLVRSDYICNMIEDDPITEMEKYVYSSKLNAEYYYIVIDIKFSTIPLTSDGINVLNGTNFPAYKVQTLIYTEAIGEIQGYVCPYAFLLGRRYKYVKNNIINIDINCFKKLGKIDFSGIDKKYKEISHNAIQWVRNLRSNGSKWSVNPPSHIELYPNMCVDSGIWNNEKKKISDNIGEITTIWNCGVRNRNFALDQGIKSWKDKKCNSKTLDVDGVRSKIIDKIIDINRQNKYKLLPRYIKSRNNDWHIKQKNDLFVDFETISDIFCDFSSLPITDYTDMIFMIGVGYEDDNGQWIYHNYVCKNTNYSEEYRIMDEFMSFVNSKQDARIFYWNAEKQFWNTAENRQFDLTEDIDIRDRISDTWKCNWVNLCDMFREEPIVIKDCFKFNLKDIANAMRKNDMITSKIESDCNSGMSAMIKAWECYTKYNNPAESRIMRDISKYNEFDCKVLWEIIEYLRNNHVK